MCVSGKVQKKTCLLFFSEKTCLLFLPEKGKARACVCRIKHPIKFIRTFNFKMNANKVKYSNRAKLLDTCKPRKYLLFSGNVRKFGGFNPHQNKRGNNWRGFESQHQRGGGSRFRRRGYHGFSFIFI